MRAASLTGALALAFLGVGCGSATESENVGSASLFIAPKWVRDYCQQASSIVRGRVLCPGRLPADVVPGPNSRRASAYALGYVLEAYSSSHLVIEAFPARTGLSGLGRLQRLGSVRVRGRPARYLFASAEGFFAHHEILSWQQGRFVYAVSVHTGKPRRPPPRELLQIALAMRRYSRAH